jgi:hypothetical protein
LAGSRPASELASTPSTPIVWTANSTVPATLAPLFPLRQARAIPSQSAMSTTPVNTARVTAPARRWSPEAVMTGWFLTMLAETTMKPIAHTRE